MPSPQTPAAPDSAAPARGPARPAGAPAPAGRRRGRRSAGARPSPAQLVPACAAALLAVLPLFYLAVRALE
ncbi:iron ABC transporter permease, partial [Streptomyces sp. NPDC096153]